MRLLVGLCILSSLILAIFGTPVSSGVLADQTILGHGPIPHGSVAWNLLDQTGREVRVGIIDGGYYGVQQLLGNELPAAVQARCWLGRSANFSTNLSDCSSHQHGAHGTATAESVIDIAPDAELYLAHVTTSGQFSRAVDWLIQEEVHIINFSSDFPWDGPGDGTSPFSNSPLRAVDRAVASDIIWTNAAGNSGGQSWYTRAPQNPDGDQWLNFSSLDEGNTVHLQAGETFQVVMRWDGPWGRRGVDLDLLLFDSNRNLVAISEDHQAGPTAGRFPIPREFLSYRVPRDGTYSLGIWLATRNLPRWVQLMDWSETSLFEHFTFSGNIVNPAESAKPELLAVGATHWRNPNIIAPYSSQGPTPDGRIKPDVVAVACGETTHRPLNSLGNGFCGTSQASPHVAGIAALVRQRFPTWDATSVAQYIRDHALRGTTNPNNTWGYGFAQLPAPLTPAPSQIQTPIMAGPDRLTVRWEIPPTSGREPTTSYLLRWIGPRKDATISTNWIVQGDIEVFPRQYTITGLLGSTDYRVQVRGQNIWGQGEPSPVATARTAAPIPPTPPLTFTASPQQGQAQVDLLWSPPSSIGGAPVLEYRVETSAGAQEWEILHIGPETSYQDDGTDETGPQFAVGDTRHYRVSARNSAGWGQPSAPVTVAVGGDPLLLGYDANRNGRIDRSEVIQAIADYFDGTITRGQVIRLIGIYFGG